MKLSLFRFLIDISDRFNIFVSDMFNINPKKKLLEKTQDLYTIEQLDNTIGNAIGAKKSNIL